jgi:hypothetical protein
VAEETDAIENPRGGRFSPSTGAANVIAPQINNVWRAT